MKRNSQVDLTQFALAAYRRSVKREVRRDAYIDTAWADVGFQWARQRGLTRHPWEPEIGPVAP